MILPEAAYDCIVICSALERIAGGATEGEVFNLAYLACLLSVYQGQPPSEWGYRFTATKSAAPYSTELAEAAEGLVSLRLLRRNPEGMSLTATGAQELRGLDRLGRLSVRRIFLDAACESMVAIPLPLLGESLAAEPQLRRALQLSSSRPLLDEGGRHAVMAHFEALAQAVPEAEDLFVPAVVWLNYLAQQANPVGELEVDGRRAGGRQP